MAKKGFKKLSELDRITTIENSDLMEVSEDSGSSYSSKAVTWENLVSSFRTTLGVYSKNINAGEIDFKSTGQTVLYTVPTGKKFIFDKLEIVATSITGAPGAPTISFGDSNDPDGFSNGNVVIDSGLNADDKRIIYNAPQGASKSGTQLTLNVVSAASNTTYKGDVIVIGYEIDLGTSAAGPNIPTDAITVTI
jgi:hypothetical protein